MRRSSIFSYLNANLNAKLFVIFLTSFLAFNPSVLAQGGSCKLVWSEADSRPQMMRGLEDLNGMVGLLSENRVEVRTLPWVQLLRDLSLSVASEQPYLIAAFMARNNVGKSTAFNAMREILWDKFGDPDARPADLNDPLALTGVESGLTKRVTLLASTSLGSGPLIKRLEVAEPWVNVQDSFTAGIPTYALREGLPPKVVIADLPGIEGLEVSTQSGLPVLKAPFNFIRTAEILIFMFSKHETGDPHHLSMVQEVLKMYGNRKMILIFNVDPHIDTRVATNEIEKVARWFDRNFDISQVGKETTPIIGTYIMPISSEVFRGLEQPKLNPVGNTMAFPDLVDALNRNVEGIWQNVFNESIRRVAEGAKEELTTIAKARLELQMLRLAIDLMLQDSSQEMVSDFPYSRMRDSLHDYWIRGGSELSQASRRMADYTARPEKFINIPFFSSRGQSPAPQDAAQVQLQRADQNAPRKDAQVRVLNALRLLEKELADGTIIIDPNKTTEPARVALIENVRNLDKALKEIDPEESFITVLSDGSLQISLGTYNKYHPQITREIRTILARKLENHVEPLINELSQYRPPLSDHAAGLLTADLRALKKSQGIGQRLVDNSLAQLHWFVPGGFLLGAMYADFIANSFNASPLWYIAFSNVLARVVYKVDHDHIDSVIQPAVQDWYGNAEMTKFVQYGKTSIVNELFSEIRREEERLGLNVEQGQRYAQIIDDLLANTREPKPVNLEKPVEVIGEDGMILLDPEMRVDGSVPTKKKRSWWPFGANRQ